MATIGFTQAARALRIDTPLGPDALLLRSVSGQEAISQLFRFQLDLLAENKTESLSSNSRNLSAFAKSEGARENTQCRGAIDCRPRSHRVAFIWRLRFAKTPLDARGGG